MVMPCPKHTRCPRTAALLRSTVVGDSHGCMPLRADDLFLRFRGILGHNGLRTATEVWKWRGSGIGQERDSVKAR